jgi:antirestriction protein ArdC
MPSHDAYQRITGRIITLLETNTIPWHTPWNAATGMPKNLNSGKAYRGINVFLLGTQHYPSPWWLTFRQCAERGGHVRTGEKATPVVFWKVLQTANTDTAEAAPGSASRIRRLPAGSGSSGRTQYTQVMLRYYQVFNVEQCTSLEYPRSTPAHQDIPPIAACEQLVAQVPTPPVIQHGASQACYRPSTDTIHMPARALFPVPEEYYSTLFHELTHATGHAKRLNRPTLTDLCPFGSTNYSKEELCAEMGAAYLCGLTGIVNATIDNSAAYLQGWLRKLRRDPQVLVQAAAQAQKAVDYLTNSGGRHDDHPA